jgi:hypothetical protein
VDWSVTGRLAGGSIPPTILTLFALYILGIKDNDSPPLITTALGIALVMTAVCVLSHRWLRLLTATRHAWADPRWTATLPVMTGNSVTTIVSINVTTAVTIAIALTGSVIAAIAIAAIGAVLAAIRRLNLAGKHRWEGLFLSFVIIALILVSLGAAN